MGIIKISLLSLLLTTNVVFGNQGIYKNLEQDAYIKASNTDRFDQFAWSIDVSGDTVVVGGHRESSNSTGINGDQDDNSADRSGAVYVYTQNQGIWTQQAFIKPSNTQAGARFGNSVDIEGNVLAVGSVNAGAVYIFTRNGDIWQEETIITRTDSFGGAISLDGNVLAVGSTKRENDSGAVYIFNYDGSNWIETAYIKASNTEANDQFGFSVALDSDTLLVGAINEDSAATGINGDETDNSAQASGAAYAFVKDLNGTWNQQAYIKASNSSGNSLFGFDVSLSENIGVVGAYEEDALQPNSGAAYVFNKSTLQWNEEAYIKAPNAGFNDNFGFSVTIKDDLLLVGARREDSNSIGVNGDETNDLSPNSGAAYLFKKDNNLWNQIAYLKASNTGEDDEFGKSVALDGELIVIGAYGEESNAIGVNGDQNDNSITSAGSAYIFSTRGTGNVVPQVVFTLNKLMLAFFTLIVFFIAYLKSHNFRFQKNKHQRSEP